MSRASPGRAQTTRRLRVRKALEHSRVEIEEAFRVAMHLAYRDGLSRAEIAEMLGVSDDHLRNICCRGHANRLSLAVLMRALHALPDVPRASLMAGLCRAFGFEAVELAEAELDQSPPMIQVAQIAEQLGSIARQALSASDAISLGGREITPEEAREMLAPVTRLLREARELELALRRMGDGA